MRRRLNLESVIAMKCILCGRRKGKRFCPAKNTSICAQCCGEKRVLEIDCPESCAYLKAGREREASLESARFYRTADPLEQQKRARVVADFEPVLADLHSAIVLERQASRDLTDAEVLGALDCLLKTLRTEDHGLIYETTSSNLRADALRRQFSGLIESYRYPQAPDQRRILLKDAIDCLEVLRSVVEDHLKTGPSVRGFVDTLVRQQPRNARGAPGRSPIIVPGRH